MTANDIFTRLRELLSKSDLKITQLSRRTNIPYSKLYRFHVAGMALSMEDAEQLHIELTGKSFIVGGIDDAL